MMIQAVLGNPHHPEYGVATIPFPIPRDQHAHCMELLEACLLYTSHSSFSSFCALPLRLRFPISTQPCSPPLSGAGRAEPPDERGL